MRVCHDEGRVARSERSGATGATFDFTMDSLENVKAWQPGAGHLHSLALVIWHVRQQPNEVSLIEN